MKTTVIILNGSASIELTPENKFEERLIEDMSKPVAEIKASAWVDTNQWQTKKDHRIKLNINFPEQF